MPANAKRYEDKYGAAGLFELVKWPNGRLDQVQNDEMLIIPGHGWHGTSDIGVSVLKDYKDVDPREKAARLAHGNPPATTQESFGAATLADRLHKSGLDQNHVHIK